MPHRRHYFSTQPSRLRKVCWRIIASAPPLMRLIWHTVAVIDRVHERAHERWHGWHHPAPANGTLRAHCVQWTGADVHLRDGLSVKSGDTLLMLHFTRKVSGMDPRLADQWVREDLAEIARWLREGNAAVYGIKAVFCQTLLGPLLRHADFEQRPMMGLKEPFLRLYLEGWLALFSRKGRQCLERGSQPVIDGWLSLAQLQAFARRHDSS